MAKGNNTRPEEMIRNDATWKAVRLTRPSFIKIKLLPQITEREINMIQLNALLLKKYFLQRCRINYDLKYTFPIIYFSYLSVY